MNYFYWDASALGKRFTAEEGTPVVNHLFTAVPPQRMMALLIGAGEVMSILVRRKNAGLLPSATYTQAVTQLYAEVINAAEFRLESAADSLLRASFPLIAKHSLNATDAIVLRSALTVAQTLRAAGDDLVLVASDTRLPTLVC
jgi:predicted nucleic acid-binding protein